MMIYGATPTMVTIFLNGKQHSVDHNDPRYLEVLAACERGDEKRITELMNPFLAAFEGTSLKIDHNGNLVHDVLGKVDNRLATHVVRMVKEGASPSTYMRFVWFLDKLAKNPSHNSRKQLYDFVAHRSLTISDTGDVLGYKGVRTDYLDCHSATFDNSVGQTHRMERYLVDDNPSNHCSYGFHVGTLEYAQNFGQRTMLVSFDPSNAVSVPSDHSFMKLRVTEYTVLAEIERDFQVPTYGNANSTSDDVAAFWNDDEDEDDYCVDCGCQHACCQDCECCDDCCYCY